MLCDHVRLLWRLPAHGVLDCIGGLHCGSDFLNK
jgi:hypothetical protein